MIWLKSGIAGDDTDGHIDNLARFVNPMTVLCAYEEDAWMTPTMRPSSENYAAILQRARDQDGRSLTLIKVPMPPAKYDVVRGTTRRLSASYMNFYIANDVVLVPTFHANTDDVAVRTLESVFPERRIVGIDCSDIIYGAGTLHCISQQQPSNL